jgi:hypothetical protein
MPSHYDRIQNLWYRSTCKMMNQFSHVINYTGTMLILYSNTE